jgi:cytochrome b6-f complex iron-sulfur subunit
MPLLDDLSVAPSADGSDDTSRRRFLSLLGAGALGAAAFGTGVVTLRFLEPQVLFEEETRFGLGRPEEYPPGTVLVLPAHKVYVIRSAEGFYALSSVCTHLGCMTRYDKEHEQIACPCHGSRFQLSGTVAAGPAPHPLPRVEITLDRGVLVVDTARRVAPGALLRVA